MALKIPAGWLVASNSFYDIDADEQSLKRRLLSEDLLLLQRQVPPDSSDA